MKCKNEYKSSFKILKGGKISLVVSALLGSVTLSFAAPTGGTVISGNANITQHGTITNINQSSQKVSINWQSFSIAANETVNFNQPNANAITLNRVIGNERSVINGALNANGQVWLLNSNGVLFGKSASINTSGLLATTAKLSDEDFQNGNYNFTDASNESIINEGTISISDTGSVVLASNEVRNSGKIEAVKGKVYLVGADSYSLNLNGNSLVNLKVDKGVLDAMVENSGTILADGGEIYLTTNAVDELLRGVVNHTGIIEANSLDGLTGHVEIFAHGGASTIDGVIEAKGGFVETSAKDLSVKSTAEIKTAHWLIDPEYIIISSDGADGIGGTNISSLTLQNALESADVTLQALTDGEDTSVNDITINSDIIWSSQNKLTLDAGDDIFINADITANGGGKLALYYGDGGDYYVNGKVSLNAGNNFFTKKVSDVGETTWTVITDLGSEGSTTGIDLQGINGNLSGNYVIGADIDASSTSSWNGGEGWTPIGDSTNNFTGNFDGLGHTIDGITINKSDLHQGFFGFAKNSIIKNIGLTNVNISGGSYVGGLAGTNEGAIQNSYVTGTVAGDHNTVGGLIGYSNSTDIIKNSYVIGTVTAVNGRVGGLIGLSFDSIQNSYVEGTVSGYNQVGGLVGVSDGSIQNSYANVNISGDETIGGLLGANTAGDIENSYASGSVTRLNGSNNEFGGLIGIKYGGTITNSYYDNEANTNSLMVDSATYGKTKAEIIELAKTNWDTQKWVFDGSDVEGYLDDSSFTLPKLKSFYKVGVNTLFSSGFGTESDPYKITNWTQLQNLNHSNILTQNYYFTLLNNLDSSTAGYTTQVKDGSTLANGGTGWNSIGDDSNSFEGNFDGANHVIDGLSINRPSDNYQGLFGYVKSGTIENFGITNVDITGSDYVGGLAGVNEGTIKNIYTTGTINGNSMTGGLVGLSEGTIQNSYSSANISGNELIGGLLGVIADGVVENSLASNTVTRSGGSSNDFAGLVGAEYGGTVTNSYYDNEINTDTLMQDKDTYGKTKAEITELAKTNWDLEEDSSVEKDKLFLASEEPGKGYTKTWVLGTKVESIPTPTPEPTPISTIQQEEISDIITPILNGTRTVVNAPQITIPQQSTIAPRVQPQIVNSNLGLSNNARIVSTTTLGESPNRVVSLKELQQANGDTTKVRVPLSDNSIVDLVNGGVNLPSGVDQQFFVVADNEN